MKFYVVYTSGPYGSTKLIGLTTDEKEAKELVESRQVEREKFKTQLKKWDRENPRPAPHTTERVKWGSNREKYATSIHPDSRYGNLPPSYYYDSVEPISTGDKVVP